MDIRLFNFNELDLVQITCLPRNESFRLFSENSKFLRGPVFSVFQHSFELALTGFDLYSISSLDPTRVVSLRNHLMANQTRIAAINSADELEELALKHLPGIGFLNALKEQENNWRISWGKIRADLLKVGEELIEMVDRCIDEDLVLWIRGI